MLFLASRLETGAGRITGSGSLIIFGPSLLSEFQELKICAIGYSFRRKSFPVVSLPLKLSASVRFSQVTPQVMRGGKRQESVFHLKKTKQ